MIPHDDRGLLLGDGLFETLLALDGRLQDFDAHVERMAAGAEALGLPQPDVEEALKLCEAAARTVPGRAAVRLTLTAGSGGRGLMRPSAPQPRLFATAAASALPEGPARLVTVSVRRNEGSPVSRWKTLSYLDSVLARREAGEAEALILNNAGEVACSAAANLFWRAGGRLFTPALDCGVLAGVVRARLLLTHDVEEVRAPRGALDAAEAVWLTNSLIGVRPVSHLDGRALAASSLTL